MKVDFSEVSCPVNTPRSTDYMGCVLLNNGVWCYIPSKHYPDRPKMVGNYNDCQGERACVVLQPGKRIGIS